LEKKRGRKSVAAEAADTALNVIQMPEKPKAPEGLSERQQKTWDSVVGAHEQGWLSEDQKPILVQYCRHIAAAWRIAQIIQVLQGRIGKGEDYLDLLGPYNKLLAAQERESRAIIAAARTLRITNQSRYQNTNSKIRPEESDDYPWNFGRDPEGLS